MIFMQMPGCETVLMMMVTTLKNGLVIRHLHENRPSLPPSPQNGTTTNLRLGTVCGVLVFYLCGGGGG